MGIFQRLSLALLLAVLLIGIGGHLLAPVGGSHHILSESTCSLHHGINIPAKLQPAWNESGISLEPTHDYTCVLDVVQKISHPPTI